MIKHCWDHTEIQVDLPLSHSNFTQNDPEGWAIILDFAKNDQVMLPQAEIWLQEHLHNCHVDSNWRPIPAAVMAAEEMPPLPYVQLGNLP